MVMRLAGLGSGLDVDSMVAKLMQAERAPLDKLSQKNQQLTWKSQAYRDINVKLAAFRDSLSALRFGSTWANTTSTSSDSTKVEVSSVGTAAAGTHKIIVTKLAQGASTSSGNVTSSASLNGSTALTSGASISAAGKNNVFSVSLNGTTKTVTIADGNYDKAGLVSAIQSAVDQSFGANQIQVGTNGDDTLNFTPLGDPNYLPQLKINTVTGYTTVSDLGFTDNQSFKFDNSAVLSTQASKLSGALTATSFVINGQTINITNTDSLDSIMSKVNNSAAGVNMYYDSITDKISVTSKTTGDTAKIIYGADASTTNFLNTFQLNTAITQGSNAQVNIDGVDGTYASNQITSNGVTYTLRNVTDPVNGVTVNVNQDTDAIYNSISDFVTKYNDLLGSINTKLRESVFRDYQPLTDEQKKAMSETDITNWENKAKSGLLHNDQTLAQLRNSLRGSAYSTITTLPSNLNSLYDVGITTKPYILNDSENAGKLEIDSARLKDAISKDPQGVIKIFTNQMSSGGAQSDKGVLQQFYESANNTISSIINTAGTANDSFSNVTNTLGKQVYDINYKIVDLQDKLDQKENYYYSMFSKMDTAIANSNAQISWLQGQLQ
ncbi:flagellar filament capping protein FliD [Paenibacillus sp. sptzw28]|uniref:flagellar filament capping protein FliD n=1 Tax=Paenibacillus sp. sptzw28 TaxID=715179 RepID=UPI001C6ED0B6|nr:flagellar filament capping protein FliD [Paenibacillus sp. sptzw28]QYR22117.1 flagellar filament capping protein FliD [Paenibacillus sp. sptzw28]